MKRAVWSVVFFALLGCSNATPGSESDDATAQGGASGVSSGGVAAIGGAGTAGGASGGGGATSGTADVPTIAEAGVPGYDTSVWWGLVGPGGLFVVDAKHYKGSIRIRVKGGLFRTDYRLYVGGRDCSHLADNMGWQVKAVETLLASAECTVPITPVLCFISSSQWTTTRRRQTTSW